MHLTTASVDKIIPKSHSNNDLVSATARAEVVRDFLCPVERFTQEANGSSGSTTIKGHALDAEPLGELTRSVATTGDNVMARLYPEPGHDQSARTALSKPKPICDMQPRRVNHLAKHFGQEFPSRT